MKLLKVSVATVNSKQTVEIAPNMKTFEWILLDTETTGMSAPIFVVELESRS